MENDIILTNKNYLDYAKSKYNGIRVTNSDDFSLTLRTISRIKKILETGAEDKERLILNYIIILTNSFGSKPTIKLLLFLIPNEHHTTLYTYLNFFGLCENDIFDAELYKKLESI